MSKSDNNQGHIKFHISKPWDEEFWLGVRLNSNSGGVIASVSLLRYTIYFAFLLYIICVGMFSIIYLLHLLRQW